MYQVKKQRHKNNTITVIEIETSALDAPILLNIINKEFTKLKIFSHVQGMSKLCKDIQKAMLDSNFLANNAKSILTRLFDSDTADIICAKQFTIEQSYFYITWINLPKKDRRIMIYNFREISNFNYEFGVAINAADAFVDQEKHKS